MTEDEWKKKLTPEQYRILREKGTETAFSGKYAEFDEDGIYVCAGCGNPLFASELVNYFPEVQSPWPAN